MTPLSIKDKLFPIIKLLKADKLADAKQAFIALNIIDTPEHLAQPKAIRHLIWDLYEFLVISNTNYITQEEILNTASELF